MVHSFVACLVVQVFPVGMRVMVERLLLTPASRAQSSLRNCTPVQKLKVTTNSEGDTFVGQC